MDLAALNAESKSTAQRDQRDQFGLAGVQSDKAHKSHRHRSAGPTTLLEYARTLPGKLAPRVCLLSLVF
jgi:hypothetical protein